MAILPVVLFAATMAMSEPYEVTGLGTNSSMREVKSFKVAPGSLVALEGQAKYAGAGGAVRVGTGSMNFSFGTADGVCPFSKIARIGDSGKAKMVLGHWHADGLVRFEDLRVRELRREYAVCGGGITLGYGERTDGRRYHFGYSVLGPASNDARPLVGFDRAFGQNGLLSVYVGGNVTFRHELGGRRFTRAEIKVDGASMQAKSRAMIEVSADGANWRTIGVAVSNSLYRAQIPADMLPASVLHSRIRSEGAMCNFSTIAFDAEFDGPLSFAFGSTVFKDADTGAVVADAKPWPYLSDVAGARLPGGGAVAVWSERPERKVFQGRPLPAATDDALSFALAGNEAEAMQFVVTPSVDVERLRVSAKVEGLEVSVKRVGYVFIDVLSDSMGARGWWPDPLLPQQPGGVAVRAHVNQPFWVKVRTPKGAAKGVRRGALTVTYRRRGAGKDERFTVPVSVRVFGFSLPDTPACESAFGLNWLRVFEYHRVTNREDRIAVADRYRELFGDHRLSPYMALPMGVSTGGGERWHDRGNPDKVRVDFDWAPVDAELDRVFRSYHFASFKTWVHGLGGGDNTGFSRRKLMGYAEGSPQYERLVKSYARQLQDHYEEKGWLGKAYAYVYDEPLPPHYPYLMESCRILKESAPKIRRMVTIGPKKELLGGPNLWCPITAHYEPDDEAWKAARAAGDQFWWYITFSSREPLVNEHIEHSGIDSRLWLWQTWGENFTGILMWETAFWKGNPFTCETPRNANGIVRSSAEGFYIYPPEECFSTGGKVMAPPVDSIRFDLLREGIEDYDYFALLRKADPSSPLLKVPASVYRSLREYSTDPSHMMRHRLAIAEQLESR